MARFDIEIGKKGNGATEVSRSIDEIINKLANAEKYSEVFNSSLKGQQAVLRSYEGALKNLISQGFDRLDPSVKAVKAEIDRLTASINTQKSTLADQKAIDNLNIKLKQIASNEALMSNETARAAAQTRAFQAAINALIKNGVDPADKRIKDLQNSITNIGNAQTSVGSKMKGGGFFGGIASQAGALIASLTSVYAILNTLKSAFNTAITTDALETSFSFITGDSSERIDALRDSANRLGIEFLTLAETNKKFIAAAKASNFDLEKADKIFNSVANAGAKLKLSNEQISGTFLAIEQMISKGTVSMEELRRQLGDRLPGAFSMAAKAMGVTEAQFNKMVASGEVMAKDLLPRLADEIDKTYGNSQYQKIDSMQASLNRLKNTFTEFVMESNIASNVFAPFISMIETAIRSLSGLTDVAENSYLKFKSTEEVFQNNTSRLSDLTEQYHEAKKAVDQTGDGHNLLQKIMNEIADLMPGAVTDWDKYGNAIGISTTRINELTKAQKELLSIMNREAIAEVTKPLNKALVQMEAAQGWIDRMTQRGVTEIKEGGGIFIGDGYNVNLEEQRQKFKEAQADAVKYLKYMQDLGAELDQEQRNLLAYFGLDAAGQAMRDYKKSLQGTAKTIEDAVRLINSASSKVELKELEKQFAEFAGQKSFENALKDRASQLDKFSKEAESTLKRVRDFLKDSDFTISLLGMDDRGQAEAQIRRKYESMLSSVRVGSDEYVRLNENMNTEIQASNQKFADADAKLIRDMVQKRAKALQEQAAKIVADQEKEYQALLKAHQSYLQKVQSVEEKYGDAIQRARKEGRNSEADELARAQAREISDIYQQEIEASEPFMALNESLKSSGIGLARQALKEAEKFMRVFIEGIKNSEQKELLEKVFKTFFSDINTSLNNEEIGEVSELVSGFDSLVSSAISFDENLAKSFRTISGMVGQVGKIADTLSNIGGSMSKTGGAVGAILGSVFSIMGSLIEANEAKANEFMRKRLYAEEQQIRNINSINRSLEVQLGLMNELYGTDKIKEYAKIVAEANKEITDTFKSLNQTNFLRSGNIGNDVYSDIAVQWGGDVDAMQARLNDLNKRIRSRSWNPFDFGVNKLRDEASVLRKTLDLIASGVISSYEFTFDSVEKLTREDIIELNRIADSGQLDTITEEKVRNILKSYEILKNATNELAAELTGTTLDGLISDTTNLFFDQGENAADAWSKGFDKVLQDYMKKKFQRDFLDVELQEWYDKLAEFAESGGGIDPSERAELDRLREDIKKRGDERIKALKEGLGYDPFASDSDSSSAKSGLRGAIERMSEQTGSELTGIYRASYEIDKEALSKLHFIDINMNALVGLNSQQLEVLEGIKEDTGDIAEHTSHLEEMKSALVEIAVNTRAGKGKSDRDNGVM